MPDDDDRYGTSPPPWESFFDDPGFNEALDRVNELFSLNRATGVASSNASIVAWAVVAQARATAAIVDELRELRREIHRVGDRIS